MRSVARGVVALAPASVKWPVPSLNLAAVARVGHGLGGVDVRAAVRVEVAVVVDVTEHRELRRAVARG
jgi:hypothetical protein